MAGRRSYEGGEWLIALLLGRAGLEALRSPPETWAVCRVTSAPCPMARVCGTAIETKQTAGGIHVPDNSLRV